MARRRALHEQPEKEHLNVGDGDATDGLPYRSPEDGFEERQFYAMEPAFPLKSAICVIAFLILGIACISGSVLITLGMVDSVLVDRSGPLLICGLLMFIPGAYFTGLMLRTCLNHGNVSEVLPKL